MISTNPYADTMRSLLDGHLVLTRELAQRGHYPAIDILQSVSRLSQQLTSNDEQQLVKQVIAMLSLYHQNKDLIDLGAYKPGNNHALDFAVSRIDSVQNLLKQRMDESTQTQHLFQQLRAIFQ